jgi:hypothetical protein
MQDIIKINDVYCFISNDIQDIVINQCLGYDWNKKTILNTNKIHIIHRIHSQFFLEIILIIEIIKWIISVQKDMNSHIGYTPSNLLRLLLSVSARIAKILSVGVHMTESHRVKNIQNIINEFAMEKNNMSIQILLFSVLFILEKNI